MLVDKDIKFCKSLGIKGIFVRKGSNGETPLMCSGMNSKISFSREKNTENLWKVLPLYLKRGQNTSKGRLALAKKLVTYFNIKTGARKVRFGGDLTTTPMAKMDTVLLDIHVYFAMLDLNPYKCVANKTDDHKFMSTYWTDVEYGARFINGFIAEESLNF